MKYQPSCIKVNFLSVTCRRGIRDKLYSVICHHVQFMSGICSVIDEVSGLFNIVIILCYLVAQVTPYTECSMKSGKNIATEIANGPNVPVLIQKPGRNAGLLEMIVGVLTACHAQYT